MGNKGSKMGTGKQKPSIRYPLGVSLGRCTIGKKKQRMVKYCWFI
jgi:hypothetical protein